MINNLCSTITKFKKNHKIVISDLRGQDHRLESYRKEGFHDLGKLWRVVGE